MASKKTKRAIVPPAPIVDFTKPPVEFEILKQVGVPPLTRNGRQSQYPFEDLSVGDGFRIDSKKAKNVSMSARNYADRHNIKIVVRRDPNNAGKHLVVRSA